MEIKLLKLENFRCFESLEIDFDSRLTVLVANNGAGKTSILDAITVALSPFTSTFENGDSRNFQRSDALLKSEEIPVLENATTSTTHITERLREAQFPVKVSSHIKIGSNEIQPYENYRELGSSLGRTTSKNAEPLRNKANQFISALQKTQADQFISLPIVSYYGTGRLHAQKRLMDKKAQELEFNNRHSRTIGYLNCLSPDSTYKYFAEWVRRMTYDFLQNIFYKKTEQDVDSFNSILLAITNTVDHFVSDLGFKQFRYYVKLEELTILDKNNKLLSVAMLSDGLRSVIAMVADLAYRCMSLNPHFGGHAPQLTPGIVLIDEVDMHLHPKWQQQILGQLLKAFPRVQFIVTTHSPQVLSTVPRESVRILHDDGSVGHVPLQTEGTPSHEILAMAMGVDEMPNLEITRALSAYKNAIEAGESAEALMELRRKLVAHYGEESPQILDCERLIRLQKFKNKLASAKPQQD